MNASRLIVIAGFTVFHLLTAALLRAAEQPWPTTNTSADFDLTNQSTARSSKQLVDSVWASTATTLPVDIPREEPTSTIAVTSASHPGSAPATTLPQQPYSLVRPSPIAVWGLVGAPIYFSGQAVAPNGVEYNELFAINVDFNAWIIHQYGVYLFMDTAFKAESPASGITNSHQGIFDFSKREFDISGGGAWNYYRRWEFRLFAYSMNNLNRGDSKITSSGYDDGVGIENRYYFSSVYDYLGTPRFDLPRADFLSIGYFPTKTRVDARGNSFSPGLFAHVYATRDLWGPRLYLYGDVEIELANSFKAKVANIDAGISWRPISYVPRFETRLGIEIMTDLDNIDIERRGYVAFRYIF